MFFQEVFNKMLRIREEEKRINPIIFKRMGNLLVQIYANSPLQFNVWTHDLSQAKDGPKLQFWEKSSGDKKKFVVSAQIQNLDGSTVPTKKEFWLEEDITRLVEEFPDESQIDKIVKALLLYEAERKE